MDLAFYGGKDPRDLPRYTYVDAARATNVPATTIAAWVRGQDYRRKHDVARFRPVIKRPDPRDTRLSFNNLLETHVLRALREVHEVQLRTVRRAIDDAERRHGIQRLLISAQLRSSGGQLFLDSYFHLVSLDAASQWAMRSVLKQYLTRVRLADAAPEEAPEFFPIPRNPRHRDRDLILLSPLVAFGQPIIKRVGVSTRAIAERVNAHEDPASVMGDYGLNEDEFDEAVRYETAA